MKLEDAIRIAQRERDKKIIRPSMYATGIYLMINPELPKLSPLFLMDVIDRDEKGGLTKQHLFNPTVDDIMADDWIVI